MHEKLPKQQHQDTSKQTEQEPHQNVDFNFRTGQLIKDGQVVHTITDQQQKLILLLIALGEDEVSLHDLGATASMIETGKHIAYLSVADQAKYRTALYQQLEQLRATLASNQDITALFTLQDVDDDILLQREAGLNPHLDLVYDPALREFLVLGKPLDLPPLAQQLLILLVDAPGQWWSIEELESLIRLGQKNSKYKRTLVSKSATQLNDRFIPGFFKYHKLPVETKVEEQKFFVRLNTDIVDVSLKNADKTQLV